MKFCDLCDNKVILKKDHEKSVIYYYCKCCKKEYPFENNDICVFKKNYKGNVNIYYEQYINRFTKFDPTNPRLKDMECQNKECAEKTKSKNEKSDIIYIRYDENKMKYIYLCAKCDTAWIHPEYQKTTFIEYKH